MAEPNPTEPNSDQPAPSASIVEPQPAPEVPAPKTIPQPVSPLESAAGAIVVPETKPIAQTVPSAVKKRPKPPPRDPLSKFRNNPDDEGAPMSFIDHLMELRKRLWICIIAVVLCIVAAIVFYDRVYGVLTGPIDGINARLAGSAGDSYRE